MRKYSSIQCFTGGGTRFGYYLGSYAAWSAHQPAPSAIFATCGGSIAAWLISQAPDSKKLYEIATSPILHHTLCQLAQPRQPKHMFTPILQAALRYWQTRSEARLQRVHERDTFHSLLHELKKYALFQPIKQPNSWLQPVADFAASLPNPQLHHTPDILIGASRLLPQSTRWQYIVFSSKKQHFRQPENIAAYHAPHRQDRQIQPIFTPNLQAAVAASVADMYYQEPVFIDNIGFCMGGVMDLLPLEWLATLADNVITEQKSFYNKYLSEPAILRIFGTPANLRHTEIQQFMQQHARIHPLPFSDNQLALKGKYVSKSYDWFSGSLKVNIGNPDIFAEQIDAQWQYGYNNTLIYLNENL